MVPKKECCFLLKKSWFKAILRWKSYWCFKCPLGERYGLGVKSTKWNDAGESSAGCAQIFPWYGNIVKSGLLVAATWTLYYRTISSHSSPWLSLFSQTLLLILILLCPIWFSFSQTPDSHFSDSPIWFFLLSASPSLRLSFFWLPFSLSFSLFFSLLTLFHSLLSFFFSFSRFCISLLFLSFLQILYITIWILNIS